MIAPTGGLSVAAEVLRGAFASPRKLLFAALLAAGLGAALAAASSRAATKPDVRHWRNSIRTLRLPSAGCFHGSYPRVQWIRVACTAAKPGPYEPLDEAGPEQVGDGEDYAAEVPGRIQSAIGSVSNVSPAQPTETGLNINTGMIEPNVFSLQLNSNYVKTSLCDGHGSQCRGWQQFVYSDSPTQNYVFMQYWLENYENGNCPGEWKASEDSCYQNSNVSVLSGTRLTAEELSKTTFKGTANDGGNDEVAIATSSGNASAVGAASVLALANEWDGVEFAVVGNGTDPTTRKPTQAEFGPNTTMTVETAIEDGNDDEPSCVTSTFDGFTGETNNLTREETPSLTNVSLPTLASQQTNGPATPRTCSTAGPLPTVTITTPPEGASYSHDSTVFASYSCEAPVGQTLESCVGTVPDGRLIATSITGSKRKFTVTAKDTDGETTTVTHLYNVTANSVDNAWFDEPCTSDVYDHEAGEYEGYKEYSVGQNTSCEAERTPTDWAWTGRAGDVPYGGAGYATNFQGNPELEWRFDETAEESFYPIDWEEAENDTVKRGVNPFYEGAELGAEPSDGITQNVPTKANRSYKLKFYWGGPPEYPRGTEFESHHCPTGNPTEYGIAVKWGDTVIGGYNWSSTGKGRQSGEQSYWGLVNVPETLLATGASTALTFETTYASPVQEVKGCGPSIDGVVLEVVPKAPEVKVLEPEDVTLTGATLKGEVDPNGEGLLQCTFEYRLFEQGVVKQPEFSGATPCAPAPGSGEGWVPVSAVVSQLERAKTYQFRIVATNGAGTTESIYTFQSGRLKPVIDTGAPTHVGQDDAVLSGTVNPEGEEIDKCEFQIGLKASSEYERAAGCEPRYPSGTDPVHVSGSATGLLSAAEYKYRLVVETRYETVEGDVENFQTEEAEPHWYADAVRIPEGVSVPVTTKGKITVELEGGKALACKVTDAETVENPLGEDEPAGIGKTTAFAVTGCKESAKATICPKGEKLGVVSGGLPWANETARWAPDSRRRQGGTHSPVLERHGP